MRVLLIPDWCYYWYLFFVLFTPTRSQTRMMQFRWYAMYGMLLESVEHFLKEKYGEKTWNLIRLRAGVKKHVFVTHERYPDNLMIDVAGAASEVIGKQNNMNRDDFIQFFGVCFVKFFSNYGYDRIIKVSGRHFRDFLSGIDNLHEHMRFGYPKLMSPSFYCTEETSAGLLLHYKSKRNGFYRYVIGQIMEVARAFYGIALEIKVLEVLSSEIGCHAIYRVNFDNTAFKPLLPDMLSVRESRTLSCEIFFQVMPFSFVVSNNMKIATAGNALISTLGNVVGDRMDNVFSLRRPRREFLWENVSNQCNHFRFLLSCGLIKRSWANREKAIIAASKGLTIIAKGNLFVSHVQVILLNKMRYIKIMSHLSQTAHT